MDDLAEYLPPYTADLARARRHSIGTILARTARKVGDKVAVVHRDTRRSFTQLDDDANRVANALTERGVRPNERVAILSRNSYAFVVAYFAIARIGAISVPINFNLTASEVRYVLDDSACSAVIAEQALAARVEDADVQLGLRVVIGARAGWVGFGELLTHDDTTEPDIEIGDDDPVQLLYTSGTTSAPKGAIMTNRNLLAQYVSDIVDGEYHRDDVELHALPLYHCAALHDFLTPDIYIGATSVIVDSPDPDTMLRTIEAERVTKLFCPPTVWIRLLRSLAFDRYNLSTLRKGYYGAATMPLSVLQELGERLPGIRLFNYYGQTELAPNATVLAPADQIAKAGSAGRPCLNVETRLHDEHGNPVPTGSIGEIVHRSPHIMRGYWRKPEATAEAFRHGWFHSGDLGVLDSEGYLTIVDRKNDMIITGGENVASREVEDAIYEHPAVNEVAVFGVPHPEWIETVFAAVVLRENMFASSDEIISHARERLAGFKTPKHVVIVSKLPKNPSGKILKRVLRDTHGPPESPDDELIVTSRK